MFNIKKHSLLILMAMLIILIMPMSFASDVSDDVNATLQVDDADEIGIDNVDEALSVDDSDKLSETMIKFIENKELVSAMGNESINYCREKFEVNKVNTDMCEYMKLLK